MMNIDLTGRVAVVTGGATGIGRAVCMAMVNAGAGVTVADIDSQASERTAGELQKSGGNAIAIPTDVTDPASVEDMVDRTIAQFGQIHVLVNNAGAVDHRGLTLENSEKSWDRVLDVNLKGVFLCCKAALKHMVDRKTGVIVNIGSIVGSNGGGPAIGTDYCVSKAGVHCLTKRLAKETAKDGIRVNCVAPHAVDTPMTDGHPKELMPSIIAAIPMGRLSTPEEIAGPVLFLASDLASYITGQTLHVNGGTIMID